MFLSYECRISGKQNILEVVKETLYEWIPVRGMNCRQSQAVLLRYRLEGFWYVEQKTRRNGGHEYTT